MLEFDDDNYAAARACLERLEKADLADMEDIYTVISLSAGVYRQLGDDAKAKEQEEKLKRFNADLAQLNQLLEKVMQGRSDLEVSRQIGMLYLRIGVHREAERWLTTVLQANPQDREANRALAQILARRGVLAQSGRAQPNQAAPASK